MARQLALTFFLLALLCAPACAESISYEIYKLRSDGSREVVASGTRKYGLDEIARSEKIDRSTGITRTDANLTLDSGYIIGGSFYRMPEIDGFPLWIQGKWNPLGASWEWFDHVEDGIFNKRQVGGRIDVRSIRVDGLEQIVEVRFLTDVTLRYSWLIGLEESLFVEVKAGSVFRHAP
jgi:hypothetical protein